MSGYNRKYGVLAPHPNKGTLAALKSIFIDSDGF